MAPFATLLAKLATMATAQSAGNNAHLGKSSAEVLSVSTQLTNVLILHKISLKILFWQLLGLQLQFSQVAQLESCKLSRALEVWLLIWPMESVRLPNSKNSLNMLEKN